MPRILIADDNPMLRKLYSMEFEGEGYEVVLAEDGDEALAQCREHTPDVVVLDIGMPGKSGLDVLHELAGMNGGTPIIVNTAYPLFKLDYRAHRASAWLEKSSRLDLLKLKVREILERGAQPPAGGTDG